MIFIHISPHLYIMIYHDIYPHFSTFIHIYHDSYPHLSTFIMIFIHISPHFISSNIINPISISSMALNQGPSRPALWAMEPGQTTMGWDIPMKITGKMAGFHRKITGKSLGNPGKSTLVGWFSQNWIGFGDFPATFDFQRDPKGNDRRKIGNA